MDFLNSKNLKFKHLNFKDHHDFTEKEVGSFSEENIIITTEKDFMRLRQYDSLQSNLYYLPIETQIEKASEFDKLIHDFIG